MIVKELIKQLQEIDENLPVVVASPERYDFSDIGYMKVRKISLFELEEGDSKKIIDVVCLSRHE